MADDDNGSKKPNLGPAEHACPKGDVISVGPNLGGVCPFVRHLPDHTIETGLAKIVGPDEVPTSQNPLFLEHRQGNVFNVKPLSKGGSDSPKGPAKVNSPAFKSGWDNIFGSKAPVGQA